MSEKPVVSDKAWRLLAESKIQTAQKEGEFSELPGFGKPLSEIDQAVASEMGWIREKLKREDIHALPPALQLKKTVAHRLLELLELPTEEQVRNAIAELNQYIEKENLNILWGPPSTTMTIDETPVVQRWKLRANQRLADRIQGASGEPTASDSHGDSAGDRPSPDIDA